jgi:hypothetical protein
MFAWRQGKSGNETRSRDRGSFRLSRRAQLIPAVVIAATMLVGSGYVAPAGLQGGPVDAGRALGKCMDTMWGVVCEDGGGGGGGGGTGSSAGNGAVDPWASPIDWGSPSDNWGSNSGLNCSATDYIGSAEHGRSCGSGDVRIGGIKVKPVPKGQPTGKSDVKIGDVKVTPKDDVEVEIGEPKVTPKPTDSRSQAEACVRERRPPVHKTDERRECTSADRNPADASGSTAPPHDDAPKQPTKEERAACIEKHLDALANCLDLSPYSCALGIGKAIACSPPGTISMPPRCFESHEKYIGCLMNDRSLRSVSAAELTATDEQAMRGNNSSVSASPAGITTPTADIDRKPKSAKNGKSTKGKQGAKGGKGKKRSMVQVQGNRHDSHNKARANSNHGHGKKDTKRGTANNRHGKGKGQQAHAKGRQGHGNGPNNHGKSGKRR